MHFIIQTLCIIIFTILIPSIVTKPQNLSTLRIDKHVTVDTKRDIYDTKSENNTDIMIGEADDENHYNIELFYQAFIWSAIVFITIFILIGLFPNKCIDCRFQCSRQFNNCLCFCNCCLWYLRRFRCIRDITPDHVVAYHSGNYQGAYKVSIEQHI